MVGLETEELGIPREEVLKRLSISESTLWRYQQCAGLPNRLPWFTEAEFRELKKVQAWCRAGGSKKTYRARRVEVHGREAFAFR